MNITQTDVNKLYKYSCERRKSSSYATERKMIQQELEDEINELIDLEQNNE